MMSALCYDKNDEMQIPKAKKVNISQGRGESIIIVKEAQRRSKLTSKEGEKAESEIEMRQIDKGHALALHRCSSRQERLFLFQGETTLGDDTIPKKEKRAAC